MLNRIKRLLVEALVGSVTWTIFLSPYVIFVTKLTLTQYVSWLGMQFVLVPPISPVVFRLTEYAKNRIWRR